MDIRVAIFEDNAHYRDSLCFILKDNPGYVCVGAFPDANTVLDDIALVQPDVVLMDIEMPGINGVAAVQLVHQKFPAMAILMQTVFTDDEHIFQSIRAGASGYILKSSSSEEILKAITDVRDGGSPMSAGIARKVLDHFRSQEGGFQTDDHKLTAREKEILSALVAGKSYKMIADLYGIAYETVRKHMQHIYEKLHVESMTEAVSKAIREKIV
ncbi:MAG: response regulator transcription factor [Chitinophagales bacterium]